MLPAAPGDASRAGSAGEGLTSGRCGTRLKDCAPSRRREEQGHRCFHPGLCGREMAPAVHPAAGRAGSCQMSSHPSLPLQLPFAHTIMMICFADAFPGTNTHFQRPAKAEGAPFYKGADG